MQIISCLDYENNISKKHKTKEFVKDRLDQAGLDKITHRLNIDLATKYCEDFKTKKTDDGNHVKSFKFVLGNIGIFFSCSILILIAIFYFSNKTDLSKFNFYSIGDSKLAIQEYLFPIKTVELEKEDSTSSITEFLKEVKFQNYTVKSGDTISGIAYKFSLNSIGTLIALNDISNVKRLHVGSTLKIPSIDGLFHTVKKGESLATIATKYGLNINSILDANDLKTELINVCDKLFIPGASLSNFELKKALGELFIYPVKGRLTSPFGYRRDPFTGLRSFHNGIDLANTKGTPVKSVMSGRISEIGYNSIYGNYIIIIHDGGYQSLYGHLASVFVKRGTIVSQGTHIGSIGSTGRSTGPHLHLSIYKSGKAIDPLTVLEN